MPLNVLKDLRRIYSGLNADEVRHSADLELSIGLLASSDEVFRDMEEFLAPPTLHPALRKRALSMVRRLDGPSNDCDVILCEPGLGLPRNGYLLNLAGDAAEDRRLADAVVDEHPDIELALAATFPPFREAVAHRIITRISKENALMALVTALPNVVPSFIELPWAVGEFATDTAFLTMNQIRMAFMLAAVYDRPVGYVDQKASIAAIAGGAFGWRAIARELVGKIPLGGGLIPKAAIAYAGTWVVGVSLEKAYRTGFGLTRLERREAWDYAIAQGRETAAEIRG